LNSLDPAIPSSAPRRRRTHARRWAGALFALALMLVATAPVEAGLVKIYPEIELDLDGNGVGGRHAYEVDPDTGEFIVCYGGNTIICRLFDEAQVQIAMAQVSHPGVNVLTLDAAIAANGDFYAVVIVQNTTTGARRPVLHGWDRNGVTLMGLQVDNLLVVDVSVAATEQGPWVATGSILDSPDRIQFIARHYARTGVLAELPHVFGPYPIPPGFTCGAFDQETDIGANRAGDVAMAWLLPSSISHCNGTVVARTMRAGGFLSPERRLSTVVNNTGGQDVSPNRRPVAVALEDGRFVVAWSDNVQSVTAVIGPTATLLEPAAAMLPGASFAFDANPANGDYLAAVPGSGPQCVQAQLAIESLLTPQTRFDLGGCSGALGVSHQFLRDGELSVARAYADRLTLSRVELPAQIEVNNVSVWEGNPGATTPAEVTVTLTKPHPDAEDVQVTYFTRNGSAVAGQDFAFVRQTAVFAGATGETVQLAAVPLLPDTTYEDDEHFTLDFELAQNAVIRRGEERADVLIRDDDPTPPITPDCTPGPLDCQQVTEPGPGGSVPVTVLLEMAAPVGSNLQISYATSDGTATAGADYVARTGTVEIVAGSTAAAIPLTVLGDDVHEDPETFRLRLTAPAGVTLVEDDVVITINNDPVCFLETSRPAIVTNSPGGIETLGVTTEVGCEWTASTATPWISFTTPVVHTGSGSVSMQIEPFDEPGVFERSGAVTITLTTPAQSVVVPVDQDGNCDFAITPPSQHFAVGGGDATFSVQAADPRCAWEVLSPAPWITILEPVAPVFGNGIVRYHVDANAEVANVASGTRNATLSSEQFEHTLDQDGCSYAVDPATLAAVAGDQSLFVDLVAPAACHWTTTSHASWILIQAGASGNGEGDIELYVLANETVQDRSGQVSIGDRIVTVNQEGLDCSFTLTPPTLPACPDGRAFALEVSTGDGCAWTMHSNAPWVDVVEGIAGTGSDSVEGVVGINLGESPRSATLQLRAQNISVAETSVGQEGYLTYELFDASRPADWTYQPDAAWSVVAGDLRGIAGADAAIALDASSSCSECEVFARIALNTASSAPAENLALLGWYRDANHHVAFGMDEFSNRWTLTHVDGVMRSSAVADVGKILPNTFYAVRLVFDGFTFVAEVDGQPLLSMPLQGDPPRGNAGLRLDASSGRVSELRVNAIEADPGAATPIAVFASGFEDGESVTPSVPNTSQCRLID
jgi:hypothetical protein